MSNPVIRVFGSSLCLPFNLDTTIKDWPTILQDTLQIKCINLSQPGADNFFIYHSYLENLKEFKNNDASLYIKDKNIIIIYLNTKKKGHKPIIYNLNDDVIKVFLKIK